MGDRHLTLDARFNAALIVVWALAAGALLYLARPRPLLLSGVGAAAGLVAGILQRKSVRLAPASFAEAKSAVEVRRAFKSNPPGRLSIGMVWITGIGLLAIALLQEGNALLGFVAGYVSFMFAREIVAFQALAGMRRNVPQSPRAF